ncbi:MAG: hypothetical protein H0X31_18170 [Nostocaceae cyanobacterium]|nr:hypothetical protein [Nostocaceae cyanobacterium]
MTWLKITYESKEYVINFEQINVFASEANGRITFWLPDSAIPIVLNPQNNLADYQQIQTYIQQTTTDWVKIPYENKEYLINLKCINSFCREANGRITFWLPNSLPIILNPESNPESHQKILAYIQGIF